MFRDHFRMYVEAFDELLFELFMPHIADSARDFNDFQAVVLHWIQEVTNKPLVVIKFPTTKQTRRTTFSGISAQRSRRETMS